MEYEFVFAGSGGQGILTAGSILAETAMHKGKHVTWLPAYGAEMRGGKVYSVVKIADEPVANPDVEEISLLVALSKVALEFVPSVHPGGVILVNTDTIDPDAIESKGAKVVGLPFDTLAGSIGQARAINILALASASRVSGALTEEEAIEGMRRYFTERGKANFHEGNTAAFHAGYSAAQSL